MYKIEFNITFTKPLPKELLQKISGIANEIKKKLIKIGYKFEYEIKKKTEETLLLNAESDSLTVTDFLVQLDKAVREDVGRSFKLGIKQFDISRYELIEDLEEQPKRLFTIPLVKELLFTGKKVKLVYENMPVEWIKEHYVEKSLRLVKDKIKLLNYEGKDEFKEYVWKGKERKTKYNKDPAVELEEKNWIKRTEAKGQYVYGREFTALVNVLKDLYIEKIYAKVGFFEMIFPKFEPWSVPIKSGHAKNVYPNAYFIAVPKKASSEYWQEIMDLFAITGKIETQKIKEKVDCTGIMSYAQCPPFWPFLHNRIVNDDSLPLLVYDWSGPTYRNEAGGTHGLDRIEEFNRIETLFIGTKEQVLTIWKRLHKEFIEFYDKVLDMEIKVARVTPWWMAHAGIKAETESKDIGTFDFDAYLPYRGDRSKEWLEIQNVSSNGNKYPMAFNVKAKNQEFLWSGCAGASFQRVIVAFLAQKGPDKDHWPKEVKERFNKKIKGLNELKFC